MSDRVILTVPIGNSGTKASERFVGWDGVLKPGREIKSPAGWSAFARQVLDRAVEKCGATRIELHNPFGVGPAREMHAGQLIDAKARKLDWLWREFATAISRFTAAGIEVIAYVGGFEVDPRFQAAARDGGPALRRLGHESYAPVIEAGCSIGYDALHGMDGNIIEDRRLIRLANDLADAAAARCFLARRYCETYPARGDASWLDDRWSTIVPSENAVASLDERLRREAFETWAWREFPGEVIVFLNSLAGLPPDWTWQNFPSWIRAWADTQLDRGYTVAVGATSMFDHGLTVKDLLP